MRSFFVTILFTLCFTEAFAQLEINTGYAVNRNLADGIPLQIAYDFKLKNRFYTKFQVGYKYLYHFNDFVEATIRFSIIEFHQTLSYELVNKEKYVFKPNIGLNYRFYSVVAEMRAPYNVLPQRAWVIDRIRGNRIRLNSFDGDGTKIDKRKINNIGFSFQLQNQFKINDKLWLHVTPFLEPDYDGTQNTGGCYMGIIFKQHKKSTKVNMP